MLTPREWQVLELLRQGLSNEAIGARLGISRQTVKFHVSEILTKLNVSTRREAAQWPGRPRQRVLPWSRWPLFPATAVVMVVLLLILAGTVFEWQPWGNDRGSDPGAGQDAGLVGIGLDEGPPSALTTPVPVGMTVCAENDTWRKPSVEQQVAQMSAVDPHGVIYGGFNEMHRSQFAASFWFPPVGADPTGLVIEFSGLWTEPNIAQTWSSGCPTPIGSDWMNARSAWLLGYTATSAVYERGRLTVRVEPKPAGYEVVMLRFNDAVLYQGPVDFVDPSGRVIQRSGVPATFPACNECRVVWSVAP